MSATVYAPQHPSRWDAALSMWVPIFSLENAKKYGELNVMLPPNLSSMMAAPLVDVLKEKMAKFTDEDWLVAVGDPTLIAAAAGIAFGKTGGKLRLLKWDKQARDYIAVELKL